MSKTLFLLGLTLLASSVQAGYACTGPLSDADAGGLQEVFAPPFKVALVHTGGQIVASNMSVKLTKERIKNLTVEKPVLAAEKKMNAANAKFLKETLNARAQDSVPGWFSTVLGAFVPAAWIGITADIAVQLVNGTGDAGRLSLANVAGTVSPGGFVAVHERITNGADGVRKYTWLYSHTAKLNDKLTTTLLRSCAADIVEG